MSGPRPNRSNEKLTEIAKDYCSGAIFSDREIDVNSLSQVFVPLFLMSEEEVKKFLEEDPQFIFEYMSKAGPRTVNGNPSFFSFQYLNKEEFEFFKEKVEKIQAFMKDV